MQQKAGLVLEGGAMRGIFSAGVTDILMENGIRFDGMVGVSAGAAFGCNYKSGQPGRALRYNLRYCRDKRYCSLWSLIHTGDLYGAEFCYRTLPMELDPFDMAAYRANPMEFYAVCTDVETGEPVYHLCEETDEALFEWIRASASMPMVSKPVRIADRDMLDGGISDAIPLEFMKQQGYGKNVVVLTQPRAYTKQKEKMMPLMRLALRKNPKIAEDMDLRPERYNACRSRIFSEEAEGTAFVICPDSSLPIERVEHDPEKIQLVYDLGKEAAERSIPALRKFLQAEQA